MSFNWLVSFFYFCLICILVSGCGVKSYPTNPQDSALPSYIDKFAPEEKSIQEVENSDQ